MLVSSVSTRGTKTKRSKMIKIFMPGNKARFGNRLSHWCHPEMKGTCLGYQYSPQKHARWGSLGFATLGPPCGPWSVEEGGYFPAGRILKTTGGTSGCTRLPKSTGANRSGVIHNISPKKFMATSQLVGKSRRLLEFAVSLFSAYSALLCSLHASRTYLSWNKCLFLSQAVSLQCCH